MHDDRRPSFPFLVFALALVVVLVLLALSSVVRLPAPAVRPVFAQGLSAPVLGTQWTCGLVNLAATLTQCRAAPTSPQRLYLTGIYVQTTTGTPGTYAVQAGTGANCGTGTAAIFPVSGTADHFLAPINTGPMASMTIYPAPLTLPVANAICVIGVAVNTINVQLTGFQQP